jgi:hypothetical protein
MPRCEIRALVEITTVAGQGKVINVVAPAMLPGNDMLDVVRQVTVLLPEQDNTHNDWPLDAGQSPAWRRPSLASVRIQLSLSLEL